MKTILILLMSSGGYGRALAVQSVEFNTGDACVAAMEKILTKSMIVDEAYCVQKSEEASSADMKRLAEQPPQTKEGG